MSQAEQPKPFSIVVVVPDLKEQASLLTLLQRPGRDVTGLATFVEAMQFLATRSPDVLISNVGLHKFNGLDLIRHSMPDHPQMTAVLIDARYDPVLEADAKRCGVAYLAKPFAPEELLSIAGATTTHPLAIENGAEAAKLLGDLRRWPRKRVEHGLAATVAESVATIVDVSYGGFRLALRPSVQTLIPLGYGEFRMPVEAAAQTVLESTFQITLPEWLLSLRADPIWTERDTPLNVLFYGAAVSDPKSKAGRAWRRVVDHVA